MCGPQHGPTGRLVAPDRQLNPAALTFGIPVGVSASATVLHLPGGDVVVEDILTELPVAPSALVAFVLLPAFLPG